jgi:microcystin-dependent protein
MASVATTRNRLNKQGTGDNTGTWGSVLNTQALDLVDEALDGVSAIAVAGNVTLSSANYSTDEARKRVLKLTGSPGASYTITIPSVEKWYIIHNATNAPQTIKAGGLGVSVSSASMTTIYCDGTDCFAPAQAVPTAIGAVTDFAGTAVPAGWLLCYGQAISRATYAALFGVIGTAYGTGDGTSTFNVPDCRGRVTAGADNIGGTAAGRLTGYSVATSGGSQTHTLDVSQMPFHGHGVSDPAHAHPIGDPGHAHTYSQTQPTSTSPLGGGGSAAVSVTTQSTGGAFTGISILGAFSNISIQGTGGGAAHPNVQPTIAFNKIIYAGV